MHRSADSSADDKVFKSYKLKAIGQTFIGGVSSRYESKYDRILEDVVSERELTRIIDNLNEVLVSHWPCTTCYWYGYLCLPCTLGLSLLIPGYCASYSEQHGQKFLRDVSLTARFYDKGITFSIFKSLCDSYVEIRFPQHLVPPTLQGDAYDLESGMVDHDKDRRGNNRGNTTGGGLLSERAAELSPLLNTLSGGRRMKDN